MRGNCCTRCSREAWGHRANEIYRLLLHILDGLWRLLRVGVRMIRLLYITCTTCIRVCVVCIQRNVVTQ